MSAAHARRRQVKIKRNGRHAAPSQMEMVAGKATKAAPAMAITGVLFAAPQLQHAAALAGAQPKSATPAVAATAGHALRAAAYVPRHAAAAATLDAVIAKATTRTYEVQSGDTLYGIATRFYSDGNDWPWLYHENDTTISDPNLIYPGQVLTVPSHPPANASSYAPAATTQGSDAGSGSSSGSGSGSGGGSSAGSGSGTSSQSAGGSSASAASTETTTTTTSLSGTLGCSGLEQLWEEAGGSPGEAFMAAEIAMAESGGNQYALSATDDYGYWQINGWAWGSLATYDPLGNAQAAVQISADGTNWEPWTTYQTGAYEGQC